ncbi:uncharacterized protein PV09_06590 [Verruconis gallopava]|uniref:Transcription factor Iwr1 domain-containing protein n=1 Tax=Verruconis gallopava TaxID=253628 RepID=A0A0D2A6B8_9PEZI|nr:uncharacterized protein PV09_06590 [Verruconis gallopava]KIW02100.1 hypothetical protein PV09_06590 [Verruconis gallopava]
MAGISQPSAPSVIRIKRKRDDTVPDTLYVERSKRIATDQTYIFKRIEQERVASTPVLKQEYGDDGIPKIRTTPKGEEKRDPYATGRTGDQSPLRSKQNISQTNPAEPRRFHLSSISAAEKGKSEVATFVERRGGANAKSITPANTGSNEQQQQQEERKLKRPTARTRKHPAAAPTVTPASPSHVEASMAQELEQWAEETSLKESQQNAASASQPETDVMEVDNEADYVYDTYYRHQVSKDDMPDKSVSFGHLVIEEDQEDLWETYIDGQESEDEKFDTDDEDSNAEDYYGADYPEDEVASDDEYDRDAYQYRKNADDLEEFDVHENYNSEYEEDALVRSDDEGDFESKLSDARAWRREFGRDVKKYDMMHN